MHIVIVGNGVAGITTARFIRKGCSAEITVISSESRYPIARTALMYAFMGDIRREDLKLYEDAFWSQNRIDLVQDHVVSVDAEARTVELATGRRIRYDRLVLATGSRPNRLGVPGEEADHVLGLYHLQDMDRLEALARQGGAAAVVGGGLIGIELAEMLHVAGMDVHFLVRESAYMEFLFSPAESALIHDQIRRHGIDLRLGVTVTDMTGNSVSTDDGESHPADVVGVAVGVHPAIDLAQAMGLETDRGILVDPGFRTSADGVYAVGDCAQFRNGLGDRPSVEQLWYTGRRQGRTLGRILAGEDLTYVPALFFNSAKFFDLEYQTYGRVPPDDSESVVCQVWSDDGRMLRVARDRDTRRLLGINGFNVRIRHEAAAGLIRSGYSDALTRSHIEGLLFDPEFTRTPIPAVAEALA